MRKKRAPYIGHAFSRLLTIAQRTLVRFQCRLHRRLAIIYITFPRLNSTEGCEIVERPPSAWRGFPFLSVSGGRLMLLADKILSIFILLCLYCEWLYGTQKQHTNTQPPSVNQASSYCRYRNCTAALHLKSVKFRIRRIWCLSDPKLCRFWRGLTPPKSLLRSVL